MDNERTRRQLRFFFETAAKDESPLYEHLSRHSLDDDEMVRIFSLTPASQPIPLLLFAAVHCLLLDGADHELRESYGSCIADPNPAEFAFPAFRDFCLRHEADLQRVFTARRCQTNEVRRCSYLYPAFAYVAALLNDRPLALIECGTSAGLNLNWDRYAYDYGTGAIYGNPDSPVRIAAELRGWFEPPLPPQPPEILCRAGIDLHPVDLTDPDHALWLRACLWPDQPHRAALQAAAIEELDSTPRPPIYQGDVLELLPGVIDACPDEAAVCVYHCHMMNQFDEGQRQRFVDLLSKASYKRRVFHVSAERIGTRMPELWLTSYGGATSTRYQLAEVCHHGSWIEWKDGTLPGEP